MLIGGALSTGEVMRGGPGNDLLQPSPLRTHGNIVDGGDGKDVAVTLNFSYGPNVDIVDLDGKPDTKIAGELTTNCKVTAQLSYDSDGSPEGAVECDLPWPGRLSALQRILPVSASIDTSGKLSMDMTLYQGIGKLSVTGLRNMVAWQASLGADACICDPLSKIPEDPKLPRDYPS